MYGMTEELFFSPSPKKGILTAPLSSILSGAFRGVIYSIGTNIVASFLPNSCKILIPIAIGGSIMYRFYDKLNKKTTIYDKNGEIIGVFCDSDSEGEM
jgi:uncharacterized membrane protein YvlD (DUF360 family)